MVSIRVNSLNVVKECNKTERESLFLQIIVVDYED